MRTTGSLRAVLPANVDARRHLYAAYIRLELLRTLDSLQFLVLAVAIPFGLFAGLMLADRDEIASRSGRGVAEAAATLVALATLSALGAALATNGSRLAADREDGWLGWLALAPMPRTTILLGRLGAGVLAMGPGILLIVGIGALVDASAVGVARWLLVAAALWVGSIPLALAGVLVGMYLDRRAAIALTALLYGGLVLGGGLIGPIGLLPPTIGTIGRTLPTFVVENLGWHVLIGQGLNAHDVTLLAAEGLALASLLVWGRRRR